MKRQVIVLGAGGHARVLVDALQRTGVEIFGITDANPSLQGQNLLGVPILGTDEQILARDPESILLANGIGTIRVDAKRGQLFETFVARGFQFATVVHPAATLAPDVVLEEGAQVMAGAIIQAGAKVGKDAIINTGAIVDHDGQIGAHAHIAPGATLSGGVVVGEGAHVGTGACIIQGIRIGKGSLVGAGAVVIRDVPDGARVAGVPAGDIGK